MMCLCVNVVFTFTFLKGTRVLMIERVALNICLCETHMVINLLIHIIHR